MQPIQGRIPTRLALFKAARLNRKVQARAESFRGAA